MSIGTALRQLRGKRAQGTGRSLQLQMVSMIDVVLLLLVFFLLTANFRSREGFLPAELPRRITRAELAEIEPLELVIATLGNGQCQVSVAGEGGFVFRSDSDGGGFGQLLEQLRQTLETQRRYTEDPIKNPDAKLIESMTYQEVLEKNLKVMDPSAVSLCRENQIPIIVLNIFKDGNITRALQGEKVGTLISDAIA